MKILLIMKKTDYWFVYSGKYLDKILRFIKKDFSHKQI